MEGWRMGDGHDRRDPQRPGPPTGADRDDGAGNLQPTFDDGGAQDQLTLHDCSHQAEALHRSARVRDRVPVCDKVGCTDMHMRPRPRNAQPAA